MMIKLKIELDAGNAQQMEAASVFFSRLAALKDQRTINFEPQEAPVKEKTETPAEEPETPEVRKPGEPSPGKSRRTKAEIQEDEEREQKEQEEQEEQEEEQEEQDSSVNIDDLRAIVSKKANTHRTDIKKKLTELGANNISGLEKKHFPDFYEFLEALK